MRRHHRVQTGLSPPPASVRDVRCCGARVVRACAWCAHRAGGGRRSRRGSGRMAGRHRSAGRGVASLDDPGGVEMGGCAHGGGRGCAHGGGRPRARRPAAGVRRVRGGRAQRWIGRVAGHGRVRGRGGGALSSSAAICRRGALAGRGARWRRSATHAGRARRKRSALDQVFAHVVARHWPMKIVANRS